MWTSKWARDSLGSDKVPFKFHTCAAHRTILVFSTKLHPAVAATQDGNPSSRWFKMASRSLPTHVAVRVNSTHPYTFFLPCVFSFCRDCFGPRTHFFSHSLFLQFRYRVRMDHVISQVYRIRRTGCNSSRPVRDRRWICDILITVFITVVIFNEVW